MTVTEGEISEFPQGSSLLENSAPFTNTALTSQACTIPQDDTTDLPFLRRIRILEFSLNRSTSSHETPFQAPVPDLTVPTSDVTVESNDLIIIASMLSMSFLNHASADEVALLHLGDVGGSLTRINTSYGEEFVRDVPGDRSASTHEINLESAYKSFLPFF